MQEPAKCARGGNSEHLFTDLLASAYTLQQRHDVIRTKFGPSKFNEIMAEVINTQSLIRSQTLHFDSVMYLVANRTQRLSGAAGAAIGFLDNKELAYSAGTGIAAGLVGCKVQGDKSVSLRSVNLGQVFEIESRHDPELAGRIEAKFVLSAPLYGDGRLAGCIQLFSRAGELGCQAKHVCELMSDVVNLFISREEGSLASGSNRRAHLLGTSVEFGPIKRGGGIATMASNQNNQPHRVIEDSQNESSSGARADSRIRPPTAIFNNEGKRSGLPRTSERSQGQIEQVPSNEELLSELYRNSDRQDERQRPLSHGSQPLPLSQPSYGCKPFDAAGGRNGNLLSVSSRRNIANLASRSKALTESPMGHAETLNLGDIDYQQSSPNGRGRPLFSASCSERSSEPRKRGPSVRIRACVDAIAYPLFVLLFVTVINLIAGVRGWILQLATVIMVALTTLELRSRISKL